MDSRIWLKGDTHLHTVNSDGWLTKGQLVEQCKKVGLDFAIITDHNFNSVESSYFDGDLLVMQGQEITGNPGHVNVWGKKVPYDPPYVLETPDDYKLLIDASKKAGAIVSVNHPFCSKCGFHMELEQFDFDAVEVWNTVQHSDNIKNMEWWESQLLKGKHIAAVGGSDFHHDYVKVLKLLANPTTIVHTTGKTQEEILQAIKEGRSVVTNKPDTSMMYLTCGDAGLGDTVEFSRGITVSLKVTDLKKGFKVRILNNKKVIFESTTDSDTAIFETTVQVKEKGYVRAEITYNFNPVMHSAYKFVENKFLGTSINSLPPFFWAFTNPIWFK